MRFIQTIPRKRALLPVYIIYVYTHSQYIRDGSLQTAGRKYRFPRLRDCTRRVPQQSYSYRRQIDTCWQFAVPHITYISKILYKYISYTCVHYTTVCVVIFHLFGFNKWIGFTTIRFIYRVLWLALIRMYRGILQNDSCRS